MLTIRDETTPEYLAMDVARGLTSEDVLERFRDRFIRRGVPKYLCSDNGPEFTANRVRDWLERVKVETLLIEPGSSWENGYIEIFNGKLYDELSAREWCDTLLDTKVLIEPWRWLYTPHVPIVHWGTYLRPPRHSSSVCSLRLHLTEQIGLGLETTPTGT